MVAADHLKLQFQRLHALLTSVSTVSTQFPYTSAGKTLLHIKTQSKRMFPAGLQFHILYYSLVLAPDLFTAIKCLTRSKGREFIWLQLANTIHLGRGDQWQELGTARKELGTASRSVPTVRTQERLKLPPPTSSFYLVWDSILRNHITGGSSHAS